ncbi:MAG: carbohydrate kinase family protein [Bacilli bacterium]
MRRVVAVGETLIDFTALDVDVPVGEATAFSRNPGGGPANVTVAIARLGGRAGMIGCVGGDPFGEFLMRTLAGYGVDIREMRAIAGYNTTLAFVARHKGEPDYFFVRNPGADVLLSSEHVMNADIDGQTVLHFVSNALAALPIRQTLLELMARTKAAGGLLSFDVNLRPAFWSGSDALEQAKQWCEVALAQADIVKVNRDELMWLVGRTDDEVAMKHEAAALRALAERAAGVCVCTLGSRGAMALHREWSSPVMVPAPRMQVLDTTGAGDAFIGALLFRLCADTAGTAKTSELHRRSAAEWTADLQFANHASAISVTREGAMAAMPTLAEVHKQMAAGNNT